MYILEFLTAYFLHLSASRVLSKKQYEKHNALRCAENGILMKKLSKNNYEEGMGCYKNEKVAIMQPRTKSIWS